MLDVRSMSVHLGTRLVLDGVSFEAAAGECIFVLGPNGAGKSTLLRAVAGLVPVSGEVLWAGTPVGQLGGVERARGIAYLPQGSIVSWPMRVRDVVTIGRLPHGSRLSRPGPKDAAAVDRALEVVDAIAFANRSIGELSGGERARVLLARALAVEAPVLVADEPIAALDPAHQITVLELLSGLAAQGRLVLAALHDLTLAARFATRVLVLDGGRLVADGRPAATLDDAVLAQTFGVDAARLAHGGLRLPVVWSRHQPRESKA